MRVSSSTAASWARPASRPRPPAPSASPSASWQATPPPAQPPQAVIVAPVQGLVGEPLLFDASQSTASDPIQVYGWQFGDGTSATGA